ncbi:MAG: hypothetical protein GC152_15700 [Alphaproteobacteria bacterium]|nr:hypothetical protein [Alphaproteobacteria bacterium]
MSETTDVVYERKSSAGFWVFLPIILFLLVGAGLSFAAYVYAEPELTALESMGAGFGGLAGVIVGLFAALFGIIVALVGAVIGLITAAGAIAVTIFFIGSPLIAIILFVLLMRERGERNKVVEALNRYGSRARAA